jgi:preprotein translocase subunit SecB
VPDADKYASFLDLIELTSVDCLEIIASRAPDLPEFQEGKLDSQCRTEVRKVAEGALAAIARVTVKGSTEDGESIFQCKATIQLTYGFTSPSADPVPQDILQFFAVNNVPVNAWPYVRELVSSVTMRMGVGTVVLGLLKAVPHSEARNEA